MMDVQLAKWTYMTLLIVSAYGVLLALLNGTWMAWQRRNAKLK
jgi:hypothetical protein